MSKQQTTAGDKWGEPISAERQTELKGYLDRWEAEADHGERTGPFQAVWLTGADVFWLAAVDESISFADSADLHLEGAYLRYAQLDGAKLSQAHLEGAQVKGVHLEKVYLVGTRFEGASLPFATLQNALLDEAHFERVDLSNAALDRASLRRARLEGADLGSAHLETL